MYFFTFAKSNNEWLGYWIAMSFVAMVGIGLITGMQDVFANAPKRVVQTQEEILQKQTEMEIRKIEVFFKSHKTFREKRKGKK